MQHPIPGSDKHLEVLLSQVKDWQLTHGSLLKLVKTDTHHTVMARPVGVSIFPTNFPRNLFYKALGLQKTFNKLYIAVADDDEWLYSNLKSLIELDPLAFVLWSIHEEVKQEGYMQDLTLGIFRSDYMLHVEKSDLVPDGHELQLRQVEFNTFSCAGGAHGNKVSDMHRHLHRAGAYISLQSEISDNLEDIEHTNSGDLPRNHTIKTLSMGLAEAHRNYGTPKSQAAAKTCVLFIVQPGNFNIADERPLEYALWDNDPSIPAYRVIFGRDVLIYTSLSSSRELLYHSPSQPSSELPMEVSVVYMRAGYDVSEYDTDGKMARLQLERSRAIKCPSILSHITTFKKVQQLLAEPGLLERFLPAEEATVIAETFARMYPMDESDAGRHARKAALDEEASAGYVLKPSLEGGGHNVYGDDIPEFLSQVPMSLWNQYILMEKIVPPVLHNTLVSASGVYEGPVISELGVFGVSLWRRGRGRDMGDEKFQSATATATYPELVTDLESSWVFKTKNASVNEMSVVKGYGCFDSPFLVDQATFSSSC